MFYNKCRDKLLTGDHYKTYNIYVGPWLFRGGKLLWPQLFHDPRGQLFEQVMWARFRWGMLLQPAAKPDPLGLHLLPCSLRCLVYTAVGKLIPTVN